MAINHSVFRIGHGSFWRDKFIIAGNGKAVAFKRINFRIDFYAGKQRYSLGAKCVNVEIGGKHFFIGVNAGDFFVISENISYLGVIFKNYPIFFATDFLHGFGKEMAITAFIISIKNSAGQFFFI
ncbi:MAG: hypothetical protein A2887_03550 [Alphaproteobacteria bacterium RIFCSPLOWO2_01_FULL_40_26]|nr:MAG: hypothetical protein A3D15_04705 [Alphaproteobacteria bacterium RIFCSPHIGHO2_02_FULL_40_34]OFW95274.1 MAG: hypothetical protein A2887_03550 [Alphaproteobacteria bacterium RIFCSPLOWO2_01_FULL_40_26]OFX09177.1 MAG: hypothetical protein A3H30_06255 [Alphaproteobacteria bacterium RIFCSPLOWO2_02_FULL_40_19]OFX11533.1 MAG: hypothetical protein A3G22_04860 [Alphaproteobacteria bacterium RIFCSPLOWO2_12_FULL_40_11]